MRTAQLQRINVLWFLSLGVTALAAGILVYLLLIESALGSFSIREASPASLGERHRPAVFVFESARSREAYEKLYPGGVGAARYDSTIASWMRRLSDEAPAGTLNALDDSRLGRRDVLILPSALALDESERSFVRAFVDEGGSVLVSWAAGLYNEKLDWTGWSFVSDLFGADFERFVEPGPSEYRTSGRAYRAVAVPGVYLPKYVFDRLHEGQTRRLSVSAAAAKEDARDRAAAVSFSPLSGYVWFDTLGVVPRGTDFATVEVRTDSTGAPADSVAVSFHTWIGGRADAGLPYPRTDPTTRRFTFRGDTPLSAGIPGGYRAKVRVFNPGVSLKIRNASAMHRAGFWYDFAQDPPSEQSVRSPSSGLLYGEKGAGRIVFMGFGPDALDASFRDFEDLIVLDRLYRNTLHYLRREPVVWTHDWPHEFAAAVLLSPVVEASRDGVRELAGLLGEENIQATFFVDPDVGVRQELEAGIEAGGEIALYGDPRRDAARRRLASDRERLSALFGSPVTGFKSARRGKLDEASMRTLAESGFSYFLPDSVGRRTTPKIMGSPVERLTRVGRSVYDASGDVLADTTLSADEKVDRLLSEAYRVLSEGGVYVFSPRASLFTDADRLAALRSFLRRLKLERFWFTTGSELVNWWRLRKGLNADVEQRSDSRLFVRLSNDNGDEAERATVSISLKNRVDSLVVRPELINILKPVPDEIDVPPHRLDVEGTLLRLSIHELKPQQYRIFHVDLIGGASSNRPAAR